MRHAIPADQNWNRTPILIWRGVSSCVRVEAARLPEIRIQRLKGRLRIRIVVERYLAVEQVEDVGQQRDVLVPADAEPVVRVNGGVVLSRCPGKEPVYRVEARAAH